MSQSVYQGAERKWLSPKEAEGPIPDFSSLAQSQSLSDGAFFGSAKNVTSEFHISTPDPAVSLAPHAEARPRPPMRLHARQGTAFTKAAEASALPPNQGPHGTPSPYTQAPSSSLGSGFSKNPDAPASELMPFPEETLGYLCSAGAGFATAKGVTADEVKENQGFQ